MKKYASILYFCLATSSHADTISNYMNIAVNIPQMQMKADPAAQSWARSARNVLMVSSESIAESLKLANQTATAQGHPFFCLPAGEELSSVMLDGIIQQTFKELSAQQSDINNKSVADIAFIGLRKKYPCAQNQFKAHTTETAASSPWDNSIKQKMVSAEE